MPDMRVSQLWRYPVKSLKGETLTSATLTRDGVEGDRVVHVAGLKGPLTGRTRHGLITLAATTGPDGMPQVDGHRWDSEHAAELVHRHAGPEARLVADRSPERFDMLNLLVATDGAVERFGHDVRRLRPNFVVSGVAADLEPELPGTALAIGDIVIGVHSVRSGASSRRWIRTPAIRTSTCSVGSETSSATSLRSTPGSFAAAS